MQEKGKNASRAGGIEKGREHVPSLFTKAKGRSGEGFKKRRPPPVNLHLLGVPKHFHCAEVAAHGARFLMFVGFAALVEDSGVDGGFAHGGPVKGHAGLRHLGFAGERMGAAKCHFPGKP